MTSSGVPVGSVTSSTAVPPGICLIHGPFAGRACPTCVSGVNVPQSPPMVDPLHWLYKAGFEDGYQAASRERDLSPMGRKR